jgi:hypothetical protein
MLPEMNRATNDPRFGILVGIPPSQVDAENK